MKVILKSSYTNSLKHALNNIDYISNREGIIIDSESSSLSQKNYMKALEENFKIDELEDLEERLNYLDNPTKANASLYINELEEMFSHLKSDPIKNLDYISNRKGSHGLFNADGLVELETVKQEFLEHANNFDEARFFNHIIAIKGEDAQRTGFDKLDKWQNMVKNIMPLFCSKMGIDINNVKYSCAMHDHKNPHVHISMFDTSNKGFLKKNDLKYFRKLIAKEIYTDELNHAAKKYYNLKNELENEFKDLNNLSFSNSDISLLKNASKLIDEAQGKKTYEYLNKDLKLIINQLVKSSIFNTKKQEILFKDLLAASNEYTNFFSNDDNTEKSILNPSKFDKKVLQNNLIKAIIENKEYINTINFKDEFTNTDEKQFDILFKNVINGITNYVNDLKYHNFFNGNVLKYQDLTNEEKEIVNECFKKFINDNLKASVLVDEYVDEKLKTIFYDNQENKNESYKIFKDKHFMEYKDNFINGFQDTKIHQHILNCLNSNQKFVDEIIVSNQKESILNWHKKVDTEINLDTKLFYDNHCKFDVILKLKTITKALSIAGLKNDEVIESLSQIIINNKLDELYDSEELIQKSSELLAREKTINDLNNKSLQLTKKEHFFLSHASNEKIEVKKEYDFEPNKQQSTSINASPLNISMGILKILESFKSTSNNSQGKNQNQSKKSKKKEQDIENMSM